MTRKGYFYTRKAKVFTQLSRRHHNESPPFIKTGGRKVLL